jgi:hypothetical protein
MMLKKSIRIQLNEFMIRLQGSKILFNFQTNFFDTSSVFLDIFCWEGKLNFNSASLEKVLLIMGKVAERSNLEWRNFSIIRNVFEEAWSVVFRRWKIEGEF